MQAVQVFAHVRAALKAPAGGHLHQFNALGLPFGFQFGQQRADVLFAQAVLKQSGHVAQAQSLLPAQECGFQDSQSVGHSHCSNSGADSACARSAKVACSGTPKRLLQTAARVQAPGRLERRDIVPKAPIGQQGGQIRRQGTFKGQRRTGNRVGKSQSEGVERLPGKPRHGWAAIHRIPQ